ncbi:MAG: type II toxin-antitoxin system HicA family toxin [Coriobacteriales bacterium]|nr:type II toxin-antitoxin system HicA family toxin [Coriobacteriales bacterium]
METPTVREVIIRLEHEGFIKVRQKGSHRRYVKGSKKVTVAGNPREHLDPKTYRSIERQAGW